MITGMNRMDSKLLALLLVVVTLMGCGRSQMEESGFEDQARTKPVVAAVNYPLGYFAEFLAEGEIEVLMPFSRDGDPAFWEPTDKALIPVMEADLILLNGAGYAKWVGTAFLPQRKLVDTSGSFESKYLQAEAKKHQHGPQGEHDHGGTAFTTWLDPDLAAAQAEAVAIGLKSLKGVDAVVIDQRLKLLQENLESLDMAMDKVAKRLAGKRIFASHPVYQYLARKYQLGIHSFHWEPDVEITEEQWKELDEELTKKRATLVLWEGDPIGANRLGLDQRGVPMVVFDPCGNVPDEGDYLFVMQENIQQLSAMLDRLSE